MKKKTSPNTEVQRLTVERLDKEAEVVRVESVPLSGKYTTEKFTKELAQKEIEELSWWDADSEKSEMYRIKELREKLGLREDEELSENMVFWIIKQSGKPLMVFHATQPARMLSKKLYTSLAERPKTIEE